MRGDDDARAPVDVARGDATSRVDGDDGLAGAVHGAGEVIGEGFEHAGSRRGGRWASHEISRVSGCTCQFVAHPPEWNNGWWVKRRGSPERLTSCSIKRRRALASRPGLASTKCVSRSVRVIRFQSPYPPAGVIPSGGRRPESRNRDRPDSGALYLHGRDSSTRSA